MPEPSIDLANEFEASTGVPLDDFSAVGTALWARSLQVPGQPIPMAYFASYNWDSDRLERTLRLVSREPHELAELLANDDQQLGFQWSFDRLRQFPVVRLSKGYLVLSPRLLFERMFGWLPIFDLVQGFVDSSDPRRGHRARKFFEDVCERQALDSLRAIGGDGFGKRLYDDDDLRRAFGTTREVADATFDAGSAWIVVEVSTRQLMRGARGGDSESDLSVDLERGVYEKASQLDSTIRALEGDESRLTGSAAVTGRRLLPLLVATEGFPVNPMTTSAIDRELHERGLLRGGLVGRLRIIDQEELYMIESLVETGQASFLELLDSWGQASLAGMDMKTWLVTSRFDPGMPARVEDAFRRSWRPALSALGVDPDAPDDDRASTADG
jgi:hypothetical protein